MAQATYALAPFYDRGSNLSRSLEIYEMPIKVFEDGVIKKVWLEATSSEQKQADFKTWPDNI